jgi:putative ABC transport system substrate-binding protein
LTARAQQPALPVIGFLVAAGPVRSTPSTPSAFAKGLNEMGYIEGRNVAFEVRWAENQPDRLPALAADLVRRRVAVIVDGGTPETLAAKAATTTIPIVFGTGGDPVDLGLVASLNRPDGNLTGIAFLYSELAPKQFQLLRELIPGATLFGALVNPTVPRTNPLSLFSRQRRAYWACNSFL